MNNTLAKDITQITYLLIHTVEFYTCIMPDMQSSVKQFKAQVNGEGATGREFRVKIGLLLVKRAQKSRTAYKRAVWLTIQSLLLSGRRHVPGDQSPTHLTSCSCGSRSADIEVTGDNHVHLDIFTMTYISGVDHPPTSSTKLDERRWWWQSDYIDDHSR